MGSTSAAKRAHSRSMTRRTAGVASPSQASRAPKSLPRFLRAASASLTKRSTLKKPPGFFSVNSTSSALLMTDSQNTCHAWASPRATPKRSASQ